jgi:hypothetical protein
MALERCQGRFLPFGRVAVHQFASIMFFEQLFEAMMDEVPADGGG